MTLDKYLKEVEIQADVTILEKSVWRNVKCLLEIIRVQNEALTYLDDVFDDVRKAQAKVQEIVDESSR